MAISSVLGSSALLPAGLGFRNVLINGDFKIWQRTTSSAITAASTTSYYADRWACYRGVSGSTISRQTASLEGFQYCARLQRDSGNTAVNSLNIYQSLETVNSIPLAGKTVTLSWYARAGANFSGSAMTVGINTGTGTDQNIYTGYTGNIGALDTTQVITTTWTRYTKTAILSSSATEVGLFFGYNPTGTAGAADYIEITGVQLEQNYQPTPFEQRPYGVELGMCQRYYETSYNGVPAGTNTAVGVVYASGSTDAYQSFVLPSPLWLTLKRATPTVTVYSLAGTVNKWNCSRSGVSDTEITVSNSGGYASPRSQLLYISTSAAFVAATGYGHFVASAEL
jgi:hypothetical protein